VMSTASARTRLSVRVAGAGCAALTALAGASLAGCSGSTPSASPTTFSPGTGSATAKPGRSASPSPGHSSSPGHHHSSPARHHSSPARHHSSPAASDSPSPGSGTTHRARHTPPAVAPATGGGGTAGFQHLSLLAIGAAAIAAGAGSLFYRRRVMRGR
jgi:hypothetical protein